MNEIKKMRITHRHGRTNIYDDNNTNITETMMVTSVSFSHDAGDKPVIQITIHPEDLELDYDTP